MRFATSGSLLAAAAATLAAGETKIPEAASMPGCTQYTTIDGTTLPACVVETVTQQTTVTSLRHSGASGIASSSEETFPVFSYEPMWTNSSSIHLPATTQPTAASVGLSTKSTHHSSSKKGKSSHTSPAPSILDTIPSLAPTGASLGFPLSSLVTSSVHVSHGPYANSTAGIATSSGLIGSGSAGKTPCESSSKSHMSGSKAHTQPKSSKPAAQHTQTVIVTATITVNGTVLKTTSAVSTQISMAPLPSLPSAPPSVPAKGPPEVTLSTSKTSEKPSSPAKPTQSCTLPRNPNFGKCVLKDVETKTKINGTQALVTASGSPEIYKAVCDCTKIQGVSKNHTMPVPVEVCGALMCPNEHLANLEPEKSHPASAKPSGFTTSPKPPQITGPAVANGTAVETASKHHSSSKKPSAMNETTLAHAGTVTGRVTVNLPVPTDAISSVTKAVESDLSAEAGVSVFTSIEGAISSHAAEQASASGIA